MVIIVKRNKIECIKSQQTIWSSNQLKMSSINEVTVQMGQFGKI